MKRSVLVLALGLWVLPSCAVLPAHVAVDPLRAPPGPEIVNAA